MAKVKISLPKELSIKLEKLQKNTDKIAISAVYTAAGIVADEVKARLEGNLIGSAQSTGDLVDSLGITPIKITERNNINAKIGFSGYDRRGIPNQLKARAMESGTSKQRPRPFFQPAVKAVKKKAVGRMKEIVEGGIENIMKG